MIQIADLGGIYLVSFAIASVNGALADVILAGGRRFGMRKRVRCADAFCVVGVAVPGS